MEETKENKKTKTEVKKSTNKKEDQTKVKKTEQKTNNKNVKKDNTKKTGAKKAETKKVETKRVKAKKNNQMKKKQAPKKEKKIKKTENNKKEEIIEENQENVEIISVNISVIIALFMILLVIIGVITYLYLKPSSVKSNDIISQENVENKTDGKISKAFAEFNVDMQMKQINEYLRAKSIALANPQSLLEIYGLATNQKFLEYPRNADKTFILTDISYEAIRNEFQTYITKEFFMKEFKNIYKQSNGITHVANIDNSRETYEITRHERIQQNGRPTIQIWYTTRKDGVESDEKTMKIEFSPYNGKWLISNIK